MPNPQVALGNNLALNESRPIIAASEAARADTATSAANTAVSITYSADRNAAHVISGVAWSYSGEPSGGRITIIYGVHIVLDLDIAAAGADHIPFSPPKASRKNMALIITLFAGGQAVVGKLSILGHWKE